MTFFKGRGVNPVPVLHHVKKQKSMIVFEVVLERERERECTREAKRLDRIKGLLFFRLERVSPSAGKRLSKG